MEIRRVQMTGGSSYIMTLPKDWIKSLNIKKNDPLGIFMQSDGTLMITSKMTQDQLQKTMEFNIDHINDKTDLLRRLIGAYIAGYNAIHITSEKRIKPEIRVTVRNFTQSTIGQEVVEETDKSIILKDLLNPIEMPFDRTIKRMHIIVKGMHEDAMRALITKDKSLTEDVIARDYEVDRLHWLVARQHNSIIQNVGLAEKMKVTTGLSLTYFLISRIIERIGDHVVKIASNVQHLTENIEDQTIIQQIQTASDFALDIFNKSISSFYRKDIKKTNENIETVKELEHLCEQIDRKALQHKGIVAVSIGYIAESIRRIGEYAEDISETIINNLVSEKK
jgi:phosphate uptake regulator